MIIPQKFELEFQLQDTPNVWLKSDQPLSVHLETLKTGLLFNKPITKVKLFEVTDNNLVTCMIYDVNAAKSGGQPWSLSTTF
jgi:hypothetical protein